MSSPQNFVAFSIEVEGSVKSQKIKSIMMYYFSHKISFRCEHKEPAKKDYRILCRGAK
jgi:hypothetical protein